MENSFKRNGMGNLIRLFIFTFVFVFLAVGVDALYYTENPSYMIIEEGTNNYKYSITLEDFEDGELNGLMFDVNGHSATIESGYLKATGQNDMRFYTLGTSRTEGIIDGDGGIGARKYLTRVYLDFKTPDTTGKTRSYWRSYDGTGSTTSSTYHGITEWAYTKPDFYIENGDNWASTTAPGNGGDWYHIEHHFRADKTLYVEARGNSYTRTSTTSRPTDYTVWFMGNHHVDATADIYYDNLQFIYSQRYVPQGFMFHQDYTGVKITSTNPACDPSQHINISRTEGNWERMGSDNTYFFSSSGNLTYFQFDTDNCEYVDFEVVSNTAPTINKSFSNTKNYDTASKGDSIKFGVSGTDQDGDDVSLRVCSNQDATYDNCNILCEEKENNVTFSSTEDRTINCTHTANETQRVNTAYAILNDGSSTSKTNITYYVNQKPIIENVTFEDVSGDTEFYFGEYMDFFKANWYQNDSGVVSVDDESVLYGLENETNIENLYEIDNINYTVDEEKVTPGFDVRINISSSTEPEKLSVYGFHDDSGDTLNVDVWNNSDSSWDTLGTMPDSTSFSEYNFSLSEEHFFENKIQVRFYHVEKGQTGDRLKIDRIRTYDTQKDLPASITIYDPEGIKILDNGSMNYTDNTYLNAIGNWTYKIRSDDADYGTGWYNGTFTVLKSDVSSGGRIYSYDYIFDWDFENISNETETFDYYVSEIRINKSISWQNVSTFVQKMKNNSYLATITYQTDLSDLSGDLNYIEQNYNDLVTATHLNGMRHLKIRLTDDVVENSTNSEMINNISKTIFQETSNKFPIYLRNYNESDINTNYARVDPYVYITADNESEFVQKEIGYMRNTSSKSRIYYDLNRNLKVKARGVLRNIFNKMRSTLNISTDYAQDNIAELNNEDLIIANTDTQEKLFNNIELGVPTDLHLYDLTNQVILKKNKTHFNITLPETSLSLVYKINLTEVHMKDTGKNDLIGYNPRNFKTTESYVNSDADAFLFVSSTSNPDDGRIFLRDPAYKHPSFYIWYGQNQYKAISSFGRYDKSIISDQNDTWIDNSLTGNTEIYGYTSVNDYGNDNYPEGCEPGVDCTEWNRTYWLENKKDLIDTWCSYNASVNIFIDGLDIGAVNDVDGLFGESLVNLTDYVKYSKDRKLGLNTYTEYEDYANLGDWTMRESACARWDNTVNEPVYSYEDIDVELNRVNFHKRHGIPVLAQAFGQINNSHKAYYCYMQTKVLYGDLATYSYNQPDFDYTNAPEDYQWNYYKYPDLGSDLEDDFTQIGNDTFRRKFENGIVTVNVSDHSVDYQNNEKINNMTLCGKFYDNDDGSSDEGYMHFVFNDNLSQYVNVNDTELDAYVKTDKCVNIPKEYYTPTGFYEIEFYYLDSDGDYTGNDGLYMYHGTSDGGDRISFWEQTLNDHPSNNESEYWYYETGDNWALNMSINRQVDTSIVDVLNDITQTLEMQLGTYNFTISSEKDFDIPVRSYPFTVENFANLSYYNNGDIVRLYPENTSSCITDNPVFNTTLIDGKKHKSCIYKENGNTSIRVVTPHLSDQTYLAETTDEISPFLENSSFKPKLDFKNFVLRNFTVDVTDNIRIDNVTTTYQGINSEDCLHYHADGECIVENSASTLYELEKSTGNEYYRQYEINDPYPMISYSENETFLTQATKEHIKINDTQDLLFKFENNFTVDGTVAGQNINDKFFFVLSKTEDSDLKHYWNISYINETECDISNWYIRYENGTISPQKGCPDLRAFISRESGDNYLGIEFDATPQLFNNVYTDSNEMGYLYTDGDSGYAYNDSYDFDIQNNFSASFFFNTSRKETTALLEIDGQNTDDRVAVWITSSGALAYMYGDGNRYRTGSEVVVDGQEHHVVANYDGTPELIVDNETYSLGSENNGGNANSNTKIQLGAFNIDNKFYFGGTEGDYIDDVAIYEGGTLSDSQISDIYVNGCSSDFTYPSENLKSLYRFDGKTADDQAGSYDLQLTNGASILIENETEVETYEHNENLDGEIYGNSYQLSDFSTDFTQNHFFSIPYDFEKNKVYNENLSHYLFRIPFEGETGNTQDGIKFSTCAYDTSGNSNCTNYTTILNTTQNIAPVPNKINQPEPGRYDNDVNVSWQEFFDANEDDITYTAKLYRFDGTFEKNLVEDINRTSFIFDTDLVENNLYHITLIGCDDGGLCSNTRTNGYINVSSPPPAPTITEPDNETIYGDPFVNVVFDTVDTNYIDIYRNDNFVKTISSVNYSFNADHNIVYDVYGIANNSLGYSNASEKVYFIYLDNYSVGRSVFGEKLVSENNYQLSSVVQGEIKTASYNSELSVNSNQVNDVDIIYDIPKNRLSDFDSNAEIISYNISNSSGYLTNYEFEELDTKIRFIVPGMSQDDYDLNLTYNNTIDTTTVSPGSGAGGSEEQPEFLFLGVTDVPDYVQKGERLDINVETEYKDELENVDSIRAYVVDENEIVVDNIEKISNPSTGKYFFYLELDEEPGKYKLVIQAREETATNEYVDEFELVEEKTLRENILNNKNKIIFGILAFLGFLFVFGIIVELSRKK